MKKPLSKKAMVREAAFWGSIKRAAGDNPAKVCHK